MSRAADIHRRTAETDVRLALVLEGTGQGTRNTGVGFLDHMLDLVARHGHMDLDVAVSGDLQTGAHHTAEDTAIVFGQALDEALADRRGIARYGAATVPMDEARASCAIDISGRPYTLFEAVLPPGATGGFEHELTEEFFRAFANAAKLTLHLRVEAGTNAHHMIEAAFKAFARALRAAVAMDPTGDRGAEHQGDPDRMSGLSGEAPLIAVVDYGMGNRRSVEKALEHVGARALISSDPERLREASGLVVPGVGAFPRAMERLGELGLDELIRERVAAGTPVLGICLGMQIAFDSSTELGGARGLGIVPGRVIALQPGELKLPHIGWTEIEFTGRSSRLAADMPRCSFYHVHSFAPAPDSPGDVLATAEYGAPFVTAVERGSFYGVQFHPEKSSTAGLRLLANFTGICASAAAAVAR